MLLVEILIIILVLFFVLTQRTDVRFIYNDNLVITVSLTLFSLELTRSKRKKNKKTIKENIDSFRATLKSLDYIASKCDVEISSVRLFDEKEESNLFQLLSATAISPIILSYIKANAISCTYTEKTNDKLNILFSTSLIFLIIFFIKVAYYKIKLLYKRRKNYV